MKQDIVKQIEESFDLKKEILNNPFLISTLEEIVKLSISAYKNNKKLLLAGNGGSAADAQHIAAELVGRYAFDRDSLAALALTTDTSNLTAIANDYGYKFIFSRQISSMGDSGDIFIGISTSGNSSNLIEAFNIAKKKNIMTIAFVGKDGGEMSRIADISLIVPSNNTARIQETHILFGHILCDLIEKKIFADEG